MYPNTDTTASHHSHSGASHDSVPVSQNIPEGVSELKSALERLSFPPSEPANEISPPTQAIEADPSQEVCEVRITHPAWPELVKMADEYSAARAGVILTKDFDSCDLEELDARFQAKLEEFRPAFVDNPRLLAALRNYTHYENLDNLVKEMKVLVSEPGYRAGLAKGREVDTSTFETIQKESEKLKRLMVERLMPERFTNEYTGSRQELSSFRQYLQTSLKATYATAELKGIQARLTAEARADRIYKVIGGLRAYLPMSLLASASAVESIIRPLNREEILLVDRAYYERHGWHLKDAFKATFKGVNRIGLYHYLRDNDIGAASERVYRILTGWHFKSTRGALLRSIYQELDSKQIKNLEERVDTLLLRRKSTCLSETLENKLKASDIHSLAWLAREKTVESDVVLIHDVLSSKGWFSGRDAARHYFKDTAPEKLKAICVAYKREFGTELEFDVRSSLSSGPARDLILAALKNDDTGLQAARVACALTYREDWIGDLFLNEPDEIRTKRIRSYNEVYRQGDAKAFWMDLKAAVRKDDLGLIRFIPGINNICEKHSFPYCNTFPFIHSIIESGDLTEAETIRYFMEGIGSDREGIRLVLKDRTREEIADIESDYEQKYASDRQYRHLRRIPFIKYFFYDGELRKDLKSELSGDDYFDVMQSLEGRPETPSERYQHLKERLKHEEGGVLLKKLPLGILAGDRAVQERMEKDARAALKFYEKNLENNSAPTREQLLRFEVLARYADISFSAYRSTKMAVGEFVSNSFAFIGASAGTIPFFLAHAPYSALVFGAATGSLVLRWLIRTQITGAAYGRDEKIWDVMRAIVDGASLWTLRLGAITLGHFLSQSMSKSIVKSGFKSSLNQTITQVKDRVLRQKKAHHLMNLETASMPSAPVEPIKQLRDASCELPQFLENHEMNAGLERAFQNLTDQIASIKIRESMQRPKDNSAFDNG